MYQLVYLSAASRELQQADLMAILETARRKNAAADITGTLLYLDGNFMQVLEGGRAAVENLYATIKRDSRHSAVLAILRQEVDARVFAGWSMGFHHLQRGDPDMPQELFEISTQSLRARMDEKKARTLLTLIASFYETGARYPLNER